MTIGPGSAYFGGNATVVPVPAALWSLASAIGLLGWIRRRNAA
jgi:hypothetical protein